MVSSITIKSNDSDPFVISSGNVTLDCITGVYADTADNVLSISKKDESTSDQIADILNKIDSGELGFPYVAKMSGVRPDVFGIIWLLGGLTSQIYMPELEDGSHSDGSHSPVFTVCDMKPTVDYPRIYRSVYSMLRQLRLWIDAHKDTLLLDSSDADIQWSNMIEEDGSHSDGSHSDEFYEQRPRSEIAAIGKATSFISEYQATVILWNYINNIPYSSISARLHPADQSGVYIGINLVIPIVDKKDTEVEIQINVSCVGQQGITMWLRSPVSYILPSEGASVTVDLPGEKVETQPGTSSILDTTGKQYTGNSFITTIKCSIPKSDSMSTVYTLQGVIEAIPFYICGYSDTYAESKKDDRSSVLGQNNWEIKAVVKRDGEVINTVNTSKNTPYTAVCPYVESDSGDKEE